MVKENVAFQKVSGVGYGKGIMILFYVKDPSVKRVLDGKYVADILKNKIGFGGKLIDYKMERVEPYSKLTSFGSRYSRMDLVKFVEFVPKQNHITSNFLKAVFHRFTWSILEHLGTFTGYLPYKTIFPILWPVTVFT